MSEYPSHWRQVKIGEFLAEHVEKSTTSNQHEVLSVTKDGIFSQREYFKKQIASEDNSGYKVVKKGDVVFSAMNLWMGAIDVVKNHEKGIVSPAYVTMRPNEELIETEFLGYLLRGDEMRKTYMRHSQQGASIVRRNLNKDDLLDDMIAIPPLAEQRKIAEILCRSDMAIKSQQAEISKVSTMHRIACQQKISDLSRESEIATIGSISNKIMDYRGKSPPKQETGVPLITAKNIRKGFIDMNPAEFIQEDLYEDWMTKGVPMPNDILITTEAPLGNVAFAPAARFAIGQRIICISPDRKRIAPEFLLAYMKTDDFQRQLTASSTGSTVSGVRQGVLLDCKIPLPGIELQKSIGSFDLFASKLISSLSAKKEKMENLKRSLASDLLSGRKRVSV